MIAEVEALRAIAAPLDRARRAGEVQDQLAAASKEVSRVRREALEELLREGMSQTQIAVALGMSRGRIGQLVAGGPPPERAFFGDDTITVAIGGKLEKKDVNPGSVLTTEDFYTFQEFKKLGSYLQLGADAEVIPPPGFLRLNRENLLVICGPRLSPLLAQILESDQNLGFEKDDQGWYLVDRATEKIYRSPMDSGATGDIAYLGRLPRPDGKGYFTYIAGIHAQGPAGVIHYLATKLSELYREVKGRRFSVLIENQFNPETHEVIKSERVSPLYFHSEGR